MGRGQGFTDLAVVTGGDGSLRTFTSVTPQDRRARVLYERFCAQHLNVTYVQTRPGLQAMLQDLRDRQVKRIGLDIETGALSPLEGPLRLIQIDHTDDAGVKHQWVVDCFAVDPAPLGPLFRTTRVQKIVQYSPFETPWLAVNLGVTLNNVFDTWAAWCCIQKHLEQMRPEVIDRVIPGWRDKFSNGLASIVEQRLGFMMPKDEQVGDWMADELDIQQIRYAALDVAVLAELADDVQAILDLLGIKHQWVEGLRRWAIRRNFEDMGLDADVHMRDQHAELHTALLAARSPQQLDEAWGLGRRLIITARNRSALAEVYAQRSQELASAVAA